MSGHTTTIGWRCTGAVYFQQLAENADVQGAALAIRRSADDGDLMRALEDAMAAGFVITFSDGDLTVLFNL